MARWHPVSGDDARTLERELARELPAGHALKSLEARAIARRLECDDVAFQLGDGRLGDAQRDGTSARRALCPRGLP